MNIRLMRLERGWSQQRLARALDVNVTRISAIERELFVPTVTTLRRLARALECSVVDLWLKTTSSRI